jgi:hypothetical protein
MCVYHGTKPIEFEKGKAAIAVPSRDKLAALIDALIAAAKAGELASPEAFSPGTAEALSVGTVGDQPSSRPHPELRKLRLPRCRGRPGLGTCRHAAVAPRRMPR